MNITRCPICRGYRDNCRACLEREAHAYPRGFRVEFDAARCCVDFMQGIVVWDSMSTGEFKQHFGLDSLRWVMRGGRV